MLTMVYKYIGMYLVMGLIMTIIWVVAATAYTCERFLSIKNNPTQQEWDDFLDDFTAILWNMPNRSTARAARKELYDCKEKIVVAVVQSYIIWPANIAFGMSRMPEVNNYFNDLQKS